MLIFVLYNCIVVCILRRDSLLLLFSFFNFSFLSYFYFYFILQWLVCAWWGWTPIVITMGIVMTAPGGPLAPLSTGQRSIAPMDWTIVFFVFGVVEGLNKNGLLCYGNN